MKKLFYTLTAAVVLCSCEGGNYTVTGHCGLLPGDSVFLYDCQNNVLSQGVVASDTTFTLRGRIAHPDVATLDDCDRLQPSVRLYLEPGVIRIEPGAQTDYDVSGTPLNDSLTAMNRRLLDLRNEYFTVTPGTPREEVEALRDRYDQIHRDLADANPDNILGLDVFSRYEFPAALEDSLARVSVRERMTRFSPRMQKHPLMRRMRDKLEAIENIQIGKPFPDLMLADTEGDTVALSSLVGRGRWVLLDFWSSWCDACLDDVETLHELYTLYNDKGFEIYGVSLDNDTGRWRKTVAAKDMFWINVQGTDDEKRSEAAEKYCITDIPANFLISPQGIIVAKNLCGEKLRTKIAEVTNRAETTTN